MRATCSTTYYSDSNDVIFRDMTQSIPVYMCMYYHFEGNSYNVHRCGNLL